MKARPSMKLSIFSSSTSLCPLPNIDLPENYSADTHLSPSLLPLPICHSPKVGKCKNIWVAKQKHNLKYIFKVNGSNDSLINPLTNQVVSNSLLLTKLKKKLIELSA